MLNGMKASGMSGSLYSTSELQDMKGGVRDEDDEDEEDSFNSACNCKA